MFRLQKALSLSAPLTRLLLPSSAGCVRNVSSDDSAPFERRTNADPDLDFDETKYRNEAYVVGQVIIGPKPIFSRKEAAVIGSQFRVKLLNTGYRDVTCNVQAFMSNGRGMSEYILTNIERYQTVEVKGFFRKSTKVSEDEFGAKEYKNFYSIGPQTIKIVSSDNDLNDFSD